ncbi:thioredoxin domain-containing protein [bacterium]|nr:MAG: thioredoxin domain-containing protein [bacterium]
MAQGAKVYTNRLINEKSPYLLQHAHNPVDWHPWGSEAFEKARKEDKPIFLSIGYSTCHWCHVMEEESFSDPVLAEIMNQYFVSIKVDREERPDLDRVYMQAVLAMTGSGGWPLNVFLTPGLKPFYGGTYFPPVDRWGRPGFKTALNSIARNWKDRREELVSSSEILVGALTQQAETQAKGNFSLGPDTLKKAYEHFYSTFDSRYGGFGAAPKFPSGHTLSFLLGYWKRSEEPKALEMAEVTLSKMAEGGMYDQLGGGFHRYSTDQRWLLPHFEKMLYDQALLAKAYLEAYQATGKQKYGNTAREILEYVLCDMTHPEGGFYCAEDADSLSADNPGEKREGAFYLWRKDEITNILGKEKAEIFSYSFGIETSGNSLSDPMGEFKGKNILHIAHSPQESAAHFKQSRDKIDRVMREAKEKLLAARAKRMRPHRDDKILTDWNGLMISALSLGSRVLNDPRYRQAAEKSVQFILKHLVTKEGKLLHRYREGEAAIKGMLDDYAFFIGGLLDLYEADFNPEYLKEAKRLMDMMTRLFWDDKDAGFYLDEGGNPELFIRQKELYDGAMPSGNSIAALDLIRLSRLAMDKELENKTESLFRAFSGGVFQAPYAYPQALIALSFALGPSKEIVIAGEKESKAAKQMLEVINQHFIPNKVVAFLPADESQAKEIGRLIPFLKEYAPLKGKATAYVCENYVCKLPVTGEKQLQELLEAH